MSSPPYPSFADRVDGMGGHDGDHLEGDYDDEEEVHDDYQATQTQPSTQTQQTQSTQDSNGLPDICTCSSPSSLPVSSRREARKYARSKAHVA